MFVSTLVGLFGVVGSVRPSDPYNMYYCPDESYCLGRQEQPMGMVGGAELFVQCENADGVAEELVWNYFLHDDVGTTVDDLFSSDWTFAGVDSLGTSGQPPATLESGATFATKCCDGYSNDQCQTTVDSPLTGPDTYTGTSADSCGQHRKHDLLDCTEHGDTDADCAYGNHCICSAGFVCSGNDPVLDSGEWTECRAFSDSTCIPVENTDDTDGGCCYNYGHGAMMEPCCYSAHPSQPENGKLAESQCPTEQLLGGAVGFVKSMTCEEFEANGWVEADVESASEKEGCCYHVGYGSMSKPCCQKAHSLQPANGMLAEPQCPTEQLMGGAVKFVEGVTCEEFEANDWMVEVVEGLDETTHSGETASAAFGLSSLLQPVLWLYTHVFAPFAAM